MVEAGVHMEPAVLGQSNGCRVTEEASTDGGVRQPRGKSGSSNNAVSFSKELISFSLYGKIPRESSEYLFTANPARTEGPIGQWLNTK